MLLTGEPGGFFSGTLATARAGTRYWYRLDRDERLLPDPASRFQPDGPHGPSQVVDAAAFVWNDGAWRGIPVDGHVLYEMHVGTFTQAGTWAAAMDHLQPLAELGITTIELMPIAEFAGQFGWGYDGVDLYAPSHLYGTPDDFRQFVDRAHALGLAVILDVVYNHLGPDGNVLGSFAHQYFTRRYVNEWGTAINFDDDAAAPVREFVTSNAAYWIDEFHLDGLRLDATQQIFDSSSTNILVEIARSARRAAPNRETLVVAENEPQDTRLIRPEADGGFGLDGLWNDDFHHAAVVALTGRREAYYSDYRGEPQEFVSLAKWGFLYQGQQYPWQRGRRGSPTRGLRPRQMITFLQNHDQVANAPSGCGERLHQIANAGAYRALTAYWLLAPGTPMFFQGQEFAASSPFLYFADHGGELGAAVRKGRAEFMSQFRSTSTRRLIDALPDPGDVETFRRCKLRGDEWQAHQVSVRFHRDLLALRRSDEVFRVAAAGRVDGAVLGVHTFALRFFGADPHKSGAHDFGDDRLLIVNLGVDLRLDAAPEPLLAPPIGTVWSIRWSSEDPQYGGIGTAPVDTKKLWRIAGYAAVVLAPRPS
jgi:maltooligosyltrehalose trehalohydrolase